MGGVNGVEVEGVDFSGYRGIARAYARGWGQMPLRGAGRGSTGPTLVLVILPLGNPDSPVCGCQGGSVDLAMRPVHTRYDLTLPRNPCQAELKSNRPWGVAGICAARKKRGGWANGIFRAESLSFVVMSQLSSAQRDFRGSIERQAILSKDSTFERSGYLSCFCPIV